MNLRILDLSTNQINHLENLFTLLNMEELWFNQNQLSTWEDLKQLQNSKKITCVYFEGNPIEKDPQYRNKLIAYIPNLTQIDAIPYIPNSLTAILKNQS